MVQKFFTCICMIGLSVLLSGITHGKPQLIAQHHSICTTPETGVFPAFPPTGNNCRVWIAQPATGGTPNLWHDANTWLNGYSQTGVPGPGEMVYIPENITVHIRDQSPGTIQLDGSMPATAKKYWPALRYVRVDGTLQMGIFWDTKLSTETLYIGPSGSMLVGNLTNRVEHDHTCEIQIMPKVITTGSNHVPAGFQLGWDPKRLTRGIVVDGTFRLFGEEKPHVRTIDADVLPDPLQPTALFPDPFPSLEWEVGDEVALAGTTFQRGATDNSNPHLTDDRFPLEATGSDLGAPMGALRSARLRPTNPTTGQPFPIHLVNLSRNLTLRSAWPLVVPSTEEMPIKARGHLMIRTKTKADLGGGQKAFNDQDVELYHVRIDDFGRTDKRVPLNDVQLDMTNLSATQYEILAAPGYSGAAPNPITNRRGRYGMHFHINGLLTTTNTSGTPPVRHVEGCVVTGTPGWGFVNHSSHIEFIDCVAYDFAGSGFVTESGDELGRFEGCVAMHGTGVVHNTASSGYFPGRQVFGDWIPNGNPLPADHIKFRPQPLSDFGFAGDGFWFQGPLIEAVDNVANSCSGAGMFWFGCGAINDYTPLDNMVPEQERYAGFPITELSEVYDPTTYDKLMDMVQRDRVDMTIILYEGPRVWNWSSGDMTILADLPILKMDGFTGYANLVGFRTRFNNEHSVFLYNEDPFDYDLTTPLPDYHPEDRPVQLLENISLWNNEQAFKSRYTESTHWLEVVCVNEIGGWNDSVSRIGAELNHQVAAHKLENVEIHGYPLALLVQNIAFPGSNGQDNRSQLDFGMGNTFVECSDYATQGDAFGICDLSPAPTSLNFGDWPHQGTLHCFRSFNFFNQGSSIQVSPNGSDWDITWTGIPVHVTDNTSTADPCMEDTSSITYPSRYLVRYREVIGGVGEPRFQFVEYDVGAGNGTLTSSITLSLTSGSTYEFQVLPEMAGTTHFLLGQVAGDTLVPQPFGPLVPWSAPESVLIP